MRRTLSSSSLSGALVAAAWLTVAVTVTADVVAGSHPGHVVAVGVIALTLGIARLRHAGRHRILFGLLSSAVVAQPVAHAVMTLTPTPPAPHDLAADDASSLWHVLLTASVIAAVGAAEGLGEAAGAGAQALRWLLRLLMIAAPVYSGPQVEPPGAVVPRPRRWTWCRYDLRRGPPVAA